MNESAPGNPMPHTPATPEAWAFLESGEQKRTFSAPLGETSQGRLAFLGGASRVTLRVEPSMPELFRARFEGPVPEVRVQGGSVSVRYQLSFSDWLQCVLDRGGQDVELTLNGAIPWQLDFHGGVSEVSGDLSRLRLSGLEVAGGASKLQLRLPRPTNVVPIHIHGGASQVRLYRPLGTGARVEIAGGVSHLAFDEQRLGAIGGYTRLETPGLEDRLSRYEIIVDGGASHLTVDAR
ncbi:hypothetical protein [Hyalangium rubrum]|uniref:Cell wall-active antibiotics response LiaF-like C-terminal domain-containing protein n=1 Tax=Hyalangium rubrum TaxID=3103134 RepID=A0ABU5H766_9BACT|nr:hypothetical protein [Hyalangium sp. s54d21]MDY7228967.1 hypothetical protein [Hyalangium sp. s54d21]